MDIETKFRDELVPGEIGDNVAVPIPLVDSGRGDPRNMLGVIVSRSEDDQYRVATDSGVMKVGFSRNQFDLCPERSLTENDIVLCNCYLVKLSYYLCLFYTI